jgi:DNA-binding transcriptional LysR family regulator
MGTVDLNLLPVFVAVAETASFSRAALRLGLPKSSVSRQIAALERELGVPLFHRNTRRVTLSTAGLALQERIVGPLGALQAQVGALPEREEEPSGRLRVTAPVDIGTTILAELVARFTARHRGVEVDMILSNAVVDLVGESVDVALRVATRGLGGGAELVARRVGTVVTRLYAAPSYLARHGTPRAPADVAAHARVEFSRLRGLPTAARAAKAGPRGVVRCDDMLFAREALRHGAGVGFLPTFLAEPYVLTGELVNVVPRWRNVDGRLWIVHHGKQPPRKVTAFRDFMVEALAARLPDQVV